MTTPSRAAGAPRPEETDGVFDVGDLVFLKSGGPSMVVVDLVLRHGAPWVVCRWFDDDKNCHHAKFPETALEIVSVEEMGE